MTAVDPLRSLAAKPSTNDTLRAHALDALAAIDGQEVELGLTDSNSSCLIRSPGTATARYVVMPMRL